MAEVFDSTSRRGTRRYRAATVPRENYVEVPHGVMPERARRQGLESLNQRVPVRSFRAGDQIHLVFPGSTVRARNGTRRKLKSKLRAGSWEKNDFLLLSC